MKLTVCLFSLLSFAVLTGCDRPVRTLSAVEYGVTFRKLPTWLGGGVSKHVSPPGQTLVVYPWEKIYTFTTTVREIAWGPGKRFPDYINSRAKDGNEVALAVTIRYQVDPSPESLVKVLEKVSTTDSGVDDLVIEVARSDIRHYFNKLKTAEFIDPEARVKAVKEVTDAMDGRLHFFGIRIISINLDDFRFARAVTDGKIDTTYQDRLDEIQKLLQETEREKSRIETVIAQKDQEYNETQAKVNRMLEEAKGEKLQAEIRGQGYLKTKKNESEAIRVKGKAEVQGLIEQINALAGQGGKAILKLDIANELSNGDQKFVVVNETNSLQVQKMDTNSLLRQLGVVEAAADSKGGKKR